MELLRAAAHVPGNGHFAAAAQHTMAEQVPTSGVHSSPPAAGVPSSSAALVGRAEPSTCTATLSINGVRLSPKQQAYQLENDNTKFQERLKSNQITYWNQASTCSDNYLETTVSLNGNVPREWLTLAFVNITASLLDEKNKPIEGDDAFVIRSHDPAHQRTSNIIRLPLDGPTTPPSTVVRFHIKMCSQNCFKQKLKLRFEIDRHTPGYQMVSPISTDGILVMSKINRRTEKRDRQAVAAAVAAGGGDLAVMPSTVAALNEVMANGAASAVKRLRQSKSADNGVLDRLHVIEQLLYRVLEENRLLRENVAELAKSHEMVNPAYELLSMRHHASMTTSPEARSAMPPPPLPAPVPFRSNGAAAALGAQPKWV